jgi:glycosyltransferase involved in cell wall biosynthesis
MKSGRHKPAVSVIIPTYNRAQWLRKAIKSALEQTYRNFEIIVVDDGSTDNTKELVAKLDSPIVRYVSDGTNRGAAASRNTGIGAARGEFIAFLDDDDEWVPAKLQKQLDKFSTSRATVGVVYGGSSIVSARSGKTIHSFTSQHSPEHKEADFLRTVTFSTSVPLIRKSCFHTVGLFDETLPGSQDRDMWIRLARRYEFEFISEVLVRRYIHGEQITTNLKKKIEAKEKIYRKYYDVLLQHPDIMAHHLSRLGILYCVDGRSWKGMRCFLKAILHSPARRDLYKDFFLSIAAPQKHRRLLLSKKVGNIDGIQLYY